MYENRQDISSVTIGHVYRIIENHDILKIDNLENVKIDFMLQAHIEADALWMLSPKGIEWDIQRSINNNLTPMTPPNQKRHNVKVIEGYFKTKTGLKIFNELKGV